MKRLYIFLIILLIGSMASPLMAQVGLKKVGQSTMNFLQVSLSPRASSFGDAYTGVGTGSEAIFYNPAGLAELDTKMDAFFTSTQWIADIQYIAAAASWNLNTIGVVGVSFMSVDYGDIYGTSLMPSSQASSDDIGYIDNGLLDNVGALAMGVSYARAVSAKFMIGANMRYVRQQLGQSTISTGSVDNEAGKLAFDLGLKYYPGYKSFRFGMSIRNFATAVKYQEITAQLPLTFALGAAIDVLDVVAPDHSQDNVMTLAVEFSHPNNYTERVNVGLEYTLMQMLSVRCGYQSNLDFGGLSAGFGVCPSVAGKKVDISYSYSAFDVFDSVNRFSIKIAY